MRRLLLGLARPVVFLGPGALFTFGPRMITCGPGAAVSSLPLLSPAVACHAQVARRGRFHHNPCAQMKRTTEKFFRSRPDHRVEKPSLIARQKLATMRRVARYVRQGKTKAKAAQLAGTSVPTLWRDTKKFRAQGLAGLEPRLGNCGRKSDLARLAVPKWILCRVEHLALRHGCGVVASWKKFSRTAGCPVVLARRIRKSIPPSFVEATRLRTVRVRIGKHIPRAASLRAATKTQKTK
jgi:hypothetical protein